MQRLSELKIFSDPSSQWLIEPSKFTAANFNEETYINSILESSSKDDLKQFLRKLKEATSQTASSLHRKISGNYSELIEIGKELNDLEKDMVPLYSLLNEFEDALEAFYLEGQTGLSLDNSSNTDVLDALQSASNGLPASLREKQIEKMREHLEDAQLMLGNTNKVLLHHVELMEVEANPEKPRRLVQAFVFNNSILIALPVVRKARFDVDSISNNVTKKKYRSLYVFPLAEILLLDIPTDDRSFKIHKAPLTFTYEANTPDDKTQFMTIISRLKEKQDLKQESIVELKHEESVTAFKDVKMHQRSKSFGASRKESNYVVKPKLTKSSSDYEFLERLDDEIDACIATCQYDDAFDLIDTAKKKKKEYDEDQPFLHIVGEKLAKKIGLLSNIFAQELLQSQSNLADIQVAISRLVRLGQGERARQMFLNGRSALIQEKRRKIKPDPNTLVFIEQSSTLTFVLLRNACDWYLSCFVEDRSLFSASPLVPATLSSESTLMVSSLVKWLHGQIQKFINMMIPLLFSDENFNNILQGVQLLTNHCEMHVGPLGFDLEFVMEEAFKPRLQSAFLKTIKSDHQSLKNTVMMEETFYTSQIDGDTVFSLGTCKSEAYSSSVIAASVHIVFEKMCRLFQIMDILVFIHKHKEAILHGFDMMKTCLLAMIDFIETRSKNVKDLTLSQWKILFASSYLMGNVLPTLFADALEKKFEMSLNQLSVSVPDLSLLSQNLLVCGNNMISRYMWEIAFEGYPLDQESPKNMNNLNVSPFVTKGIMILHEFHSSLLAEQRESILQIILDSLINMFDQWINVETRTMNIVVTHLHILNVKYLERACQEVLTSQLAARFNSHIREVESVALKKGFSLNDNRWFENLIQTSRKNLETAIDGKAFYTANNEAKKVKYSNIDSK